MQDKRTDPKKPAPPRAQAAAAFGGSDEIAPDDNAAFTDRAGKLIARSLENRQRFQTQIPKSRKPRRAPS